MSDGESQVLTFSLLAGAGLWGWWFWEAWVTAPRFSAPRDRRLLFAAPPACAALLFGVLRAFASHDVRESPPYLAFYMALGAAWLGAAARLLAFCGLSARDDVIERANPAAARAIAGALLGLTLCFAGGNIGDGPGWWVVLFSALLSTLPLLLLWVLLDLATRLADTVTVDRDPAAGLRLAGFFVAAGLILGRAVAGDWTSAADTVADFADTAAPALVLLAAAALVERRLRPTAERPLSPAVSGPLAAAFYLAVAAAALLWAGGW